ncbi:Uncharacterised protein [Mycobacteroides abscessus subsp. massiliense]|nr:Uncharacterised protein [Mycobacteroides abscessus subsp. massiliense]
MVLDRRNIRFTATDTQLPGDVKAVDLQYLRV